MCFAPKAFTSWVERLFFFHCLLIVLLVYLRNGDLIGLPNSPLDLFSSINCIYYLQVKCGWFWISLHRERANGLFYFYSQTLVNWMRRIIKKMEKNWFDGSSLRNCRITWIYLFFNRKKSIFLLTSNIFLIKTWHSLRKFWCPYSDAIIGAYKIAELWK